MTKRFKQKLNSVFSITNIILMTLQSFMPGFFMFMPAPAFAVEVQEENIQEVVIETISEEVESEVEVIEDESIEYVLEAEEESESEVLELVIPVEEVAEIIEEEATEEVLEVEKIATQSAELVETVKEIQIEEEILEPMAGPAPEVEELTEKTMVVEGESSEEVTEESIWEVDGNTAVVSTVELGIVYTSPQNGEVQVTFTKLPENPGSLKIEKIELSDEVVKQVGAYSNIAYDITSDMADGTFEYELKLPVPDGADESAGLIYAENVEELTKATAVENEVIEDGKVVVSGLDHFTVFVITGALDALLYEFDFKTFDNGAGGLWATDYIHAQLELVPDGDSCYLYTRVDTGTFETLDGRSPANLEDISAGIIGDLEGGISGRICGSIREDENMDLSYEEDLTVGSYPDYETKYFGRILTNISGFTFNSSNGWGWTFTTCNNGTWIDTDSEVSGDVSGDYVACADTTVPEAPTILFPSEDQYFNSTPILNDWTDVTDDSGIDHYRIEYDYDDGHTFSNAPYREMTASQRNHTPGIGEQGGVSIRVQAFDNAGNEGLWSEWRHYFYDATAPSTPVQTGYNENNGDVYSAPRPINELTCTDDSTNINGVSVHWSDIAEGNATVKYQRQYKVGSGNWSGNEIYIQPYTNYRSFGGGSGNEGTYGSRVRAWKDFDGDNIIDSDEMVSDWSNECSITYDRTAPEVTILTPLSGSVKAGTFTAHATVTDLSSLSNVRVRFNHPVTNAIVQTYTMTNTSGDLWEYSVDSKADLPDGDYRMRVIATDEAGNKRNVSENPIVIDNSGPETTFVAPKEGDFVSKDFKVEGTASDPHGVGRITLRFFEIDGAGKSIWPPVKEYDALPNYDGSLNWYYDVPKEDLPDGEYIMRAVVADTVSGSNKTIISENFITVDNTKPTVLVTQPILDQQVAGVVSIAGTAEDQGSGIDKVALHIYRLNEDTTKTLVPGCTTLPGTVLGNDWSLFVNNGGSCNLTDGPYEIAAWAYDGAGNPGWAPRTQFYVDNTLPITTLTSPTDGDNTNKDILIEGSSTDVGIVDHVNLYYRVTGDTTWTLITALNNTGSDEPFSFSHSWTPPSDDSYDFKVSGVDTAGNEENSAYVYEIIYDTVVPVVTWSNPTDTELLNGEVDLTAICDGGDTESTYVNFWWWKASEGQTVIDARDGSPKQYNRVGRTSLNGGTLTGNTFGFSLNTQDENIIQSSYNWDGEWKLRAACKDAAGNYAHSEINMNVDNTVNTPTITAPTTGDFFNTFTIRAEWNEVIDVNGIDKYEIQYDYLVNGVPTTAYREVAGTQLYRDQSLSGNVQGEFTIMLRAYDNLGNISAWSTPVSYVFDSLDPESTITTFDLEDEGETKTATFSGLIQGTATDEPIDLASGVAEVLLEIMHTPFGATQSSYWNGSDWQTPMATVSATGTTEWEYQIEPEEKVLEGTYVVSSHAVDNAGNIESTYTITIVYDKTIPEVILTIDPTDPNGRNGWYVTEPTVTLTASDNYNVDYIEYQWNSTVGTWTTYTAPITPPGEGQNILYYRSVDLVGNISEIGVKEIKWDETAPTDGSGNLQVKNIKSTTADATWNEPANSDDISRFVLVWKHEDGSSRSKSVDGNVYETDLYDLFDGEWELTLESQDAAGHAYSVTEKFTVGGSSGDVLGTTDDTTGIGGLVAGVSNFITGDSNNEEKTKESDSEDSTKTEEENGAVLGDSDATCATWKYYLPLFLLLIQLMFAVSLEIANKEPGKKKLLLALAISALVIGSFYILKNADCYGDTAGLIQTLSKRFVPLSLVLAVILRWMGSMTVEEK